LVSFNKVGDVQMAQGDLTDALKSYTDSFAIRDRLAKSDPGNAGWQRDLSVSFNKVGDVQVAQGDLSLAILDRWRNPTPATRGGKSMWFGRSGVWRSMVMMGAAMGPCKNSQKRMTWQHCSEKRPGRPDADTPPNR